MRKLLFTLLLLASSPAFAIGNVVGPDCTFTWSHDPATAATVAGSKLYLADNDTLTNAVAIDVGAVTSYTCTQAKLVTNGQYYAAVSDYNRAGESARSNVVPFVLIHDAPGAPASLQVN